MANDKEICNSQKVLSRQYTNFVEDCNKVYGLKTKCVDNCIFSIYGILLISYPIWKFVFLGPAILRHLQPVSKFLFQ